MIKPIAEGYRRRQPVSLGRAADCDRTETGDIGVTFVGS
jgi:hypothetical protein